MSDVRLLQTKMLLLRFDGEVFETFSNTESTRYHASLIANVSIDEKKKWLQFDYGSFMPRPTRIGFQADELAAVAEFMRSVAAA